MEIKPCPFPSCKSIDVRLRGRMHETNPYVECLRCDARGPRSRTIDEAVELWNELPRDESMHEKLKPCPWPSCQSKNASIETYDGRKRSMYFIRCNNCFASGPVSSTRQHAVIYWNEALRQEK